MFPSRRKFISGAGAAAAAGLSAAAINATAAATGVVSDTSGKVTLRMQSAFAESDMLNQFGKMFVDRVNAISGGDVVIQLLPVGTVCGPFDVVPTVSSGKLDGGITYSAYQHSLNPAISLWCAGPGFGMDAHMLLAWHEYGGGKDLLAKLYKAMKFDVTSFTYVPLPDQPMGWFNKPITRIEDMKGMKFRTAGLAIEIYKELGVDAQGLPGPQVGAAIKSGKLDGGEWNNLSSDRVLGFDKSAKYCMVQSYAEATGVMELTFNTAVWSKLNERQRNLLQTTINAVSAEGGWKIAEQNSKDYEAMAQEGTQFLRTPASVLQAQLNAWDRVIAKHSSEDPLFAEIVESQKAYAKRVIKWQSDVNVDLRNVYNHYFNRRVI